MPLVDFSTERIALLSTDRRRLLERFAQASNAPLSGKARIVQRKPGEPVRLSFAQERLWLIDRIQPGNPIYNVFEAWRLRGPLHAAALKQALDALLERHSVLRTQFVEVDNGPVQRQVSAVFKIEEIDLRTLPVVERQAEIEDHLWAAINQSFDLADPPLAAAVLLHVRDDEHVLLIVIHHIVSDGWSRAIFSRELSQAYAALLLGEKPDWPPLPIQYADYTEWQREWLSGEVLEGHLDYWRKQLSGLSPLDLATDHARPAQLSYRGDVERFDLPADLTAALKALARRHDVTLYMVLLAAFQVLLMRHSGQEDIAVGSPVAGRNRPELEGLIGFFVNSLVMRGDLSGNPRFSELLARTRHAALDAYAHQDLPFEKLVEELKPERDMSRNPLFQVMFVLQNTPEAELNLAGLDCESLTLHNGTAKFDLSLSLTETRGELHGILEYSTDLFDAATIERLAGHFTTLLEGIVADPERHIGQLPLLTEDERHQLLVGWNDTAVDYPRDKCVHELFEAQAARAPDAIAVVHGDTQLTYAALNARANQLAHHLRGLGVGPDTLVGLCLERSLDLVIGILAILKAGGAYVPLDPDYPRDRLEFMLRDTRAAIVLTQSGLEDRLPEGEAKRLCLDRDGALWSARPDSNPAVSAGPDSLAYVIYTSGSTGQPKGVEVCNRNIVRLVRGARYAGFDENRVFLLLAPIAFDASTFELWGALLHGARCVIYPDRVPTPAALGKALRRHKVDTLWLTASLFNYFIDETPEILIGVSQLLTGGEALSLPHVQRALAQLPETRLINGYGPTESTTFACCYPIPRNLPEDSGSVPIGRPISNTVCHVLDAHGGLSPIGVAGELYIGGDGLARGYLNRPELTAERFVASPFRAGERLYRTGDRVRYLPDGNLEFLGRLDHQIKLRGYRIEPGEIEAILREDPAIRQSLVLVREDQAGGKRLVAYVVGQGIDVEAQRARLKGRLPDYMVPAAFVVLDSLPLTPNGKVDRKALPVPEQEAGTSGYQAPRTPLESAIAEIWADILNLPRVGIHDNFFNLGGHSLSAVQLMERIHQALGHRPHLNTLWYGAGNVAEQSRLLTETSSGSTSPVLVMRSGGRAPALFCLHTIGGGNLFHYEPLVSHLKGDLPVYGLQARGIDGKTPPDVNVEAMAQYCIQSMRAMQPDGPYFLCGFSSGGLIAYEMARCLAEAGVETRLFLVDSYIPDHPESLGNRWLRWNRLVRDKKFREIQERSYHMVLSRLGLRRMRVLRGLGESHRWAMWSYRPRICDLSAEYFEAVERIGGTARPSTGWTTLLKGGLRLHMIPGEHGTMVKGDSAVALANALSACLPQ